MVLACAAGEPTAEHPIAARPTYPELHNTPGRRCLFRAPAEQRADGSVLQGILHRRDLRRPARLSSIGTSERVLGRLVPDRPPKSETASFLDGGLVRDNYGIPRVPHADALSDSSSHPVKRATPSTASCRLNSRLWRELRQGTLRHGSERHRPYGTPSASPRWGREEVPPLLGIVACDVS